MRTTRNTVLCLIVSLKSVGISLAADPLLDRVHSDFPSAMSRLEAFYGQVRGKFRWIQVNSGKETIRWSVTFAADHGWRKASILWDDVSDPRKESTEKIYVLGPKAAFCLSAKRDNSYVMTKVGRPDSQDASLNLSKNLCNNALFACCGIWGHSMSELMAHPSFQIVSVEETISDRKNLIKVSFNSDHPYVKSGSIWTAPDNAWAIQKIDCQILMFEGSAKHQLLGDIDYKASQEKEPIVHRILYTLKPPESDPVTHRYEIKEISHEPTPEDEFTLPYYGLRDPFEAVKRPIPWYRWAALAGCLCLILAVLFRWLARWAKSQPAS